MHARGRSRLRRPQRRRAPERPAARRAPSACSPDASDASAASTAPGSAASAWRTPTHDAVPMPHSACLAIPATETPAPGSVNRCSPSMAAWYAFRSTACSSTASASRAWTELRAPQRARPEATASTLVSREAASPEWHRSSRRASPAARAQRPALGCGTCDGAGMCGHMGQCANNGQAYGRSGCSFFACSPMASTSGCASYPALTVGAGCSSGNPCVSGEETCNAQGYCVGGTPIPDCAVDAGPYGE